MHWIRSDIFALLSIAIFSMYLFPCYTYIWASILRYLLFPIFSSFIRIIKHLGIYPRQRGRNMLTLNFSFEK